MDLVERHGGAVRRHPWETSRVEAIKSIVRRLPIRDPRVLELGCGDAFVLEELRRALPFREALAYDLHLTETLIQELEPACPGVRFLRRFDELAGEEVNLVLLLDVLEHIDDAVSYLSQVAEHLAPGGWAVVTVPAFQALYSLHDRRLGHFRRYSRNEIATTVARAGIEVVDSGYFFASLILPRVLGVLRERILPAMGEANPAGIGAWNGSTFLTRALHRTLCWDNQLALAAHDLGLTAPGLSVWLTGRKRP